MIMNNALWQLIGQADFTSKMVLLALLIMSIICWAITIYKMIVIRTKNRQLKQIQSKLEDVTTLEAFIAKSSALQDTYGGAFIAHLLTDFKGALKAHQHSSLDLTDQDWKMLQSNMAQTLEDAISKEESMLSILSTSAQAAPLMGLFGTVWGLIHAFIGISYSGSADISAVAPGMAEALITTLAGLIVAVPALVMFSILQGRIQILERRLIALADKCYWIMRSVSIKPSKTEFDDDSAYMPPAGESLEEDSL